MDVRCEKCQTEYELDEARLKPGGVTVKCTNCGHMFKIRKRSNTNVGLPATAEAATKVEAPPRGPARPPAGLPRADSILGEATSPPPTGEDPEARQWLIRLQNGEQKACRELATLQQWIVAGVVTRESLISRTGKTWKRLGDITELGQYFTIADEARHKREARPTGKAMPQSTMLGVGGVSAAGGTILPDDDDDEGRRTTGNFRARSTTPPPVPVPAGVKPASTKTPPLGSGTTTPESTMPPRRPLTQPPPPPAKRAASQSQSGPLPSPDRPATPSVPSGNRSTAAWATTNEGVAPSGAPTTGLIGPRGGRISAAPDEPAFAGRVRVEPSDDAAFTSGKVRLEDDDDDDALPGRTGSRGGMWILLMALLVMAAAAGVVYVFVIKKDATPQTATKATAPGDASAVAMAPGDAGAAVVTPMADAAAAPVATPLDVARGELAGDDETRLRDALKSLDTLTDPPALALRAHLAASIAQGLIDRAAVTADKADAAKLKKDADALVNDAATWAQKAQKALPEDPVANLAMADILRLRGKPAKDVKRYLDAARSKGALAVGWTRDIALGDALVLARDGKLGDASAAFAAIDKDDGTLEASGDVRARFHEALIAYEQNKPGDAKPLAESVMGAQANHAGAKALLARIETTVAKTDPLPPEDGGNTATPPKDAGVPKPTPPSGGTDVATGGADTYDKLLARANALAETNCSKALEVFAKALEQKPNGVEALTGMGYCHIDAKQFASAFSKFRAALAVSSRYEPALWGVAEAYQQQGRKDLAIDAFKAYLDAFPGSAKAQKQLDRLQGDQPKPPDGAGSGATTPTPTPTPTPATPPTGDGAGSGSG